MFRVRRGASIAPPPPPSEVFERAGNNDLRDMFALEAMREKMRAGIPSNNFLPKGKTVAQYIAEQAYTMANAMLEERKKHV